MRCAPVARGSTVSADVVASLPDGAPLGAGGVRSDGRAARRRPVHRRGRAHLGPRGRRPSQRRGQGDRRAAPGGQLPLAGHILQVSGRVSFEIVQKAAVAGIPIVSAVSAPTSLAVEAGDRFGMTIVGFVRDGRLQRLHGSSAGGLNRRPRAGPTGRVGHRGSRRPKDQILYGAMPTIDARPEQAEREVHAQHRADRRPAQGGASVRSGRRRGDPSAGSRTCGLTSSTPARSTRCAPPSRTRTRARSRGSVA